MAHDAGAEGGDAAGIGRDQPADRGRAARGEVEAGMESDGGRRLLQRAERDAGLDHGNAAVGIDLLDPVEHAEIADQLLGRGDGAADEARPPTLRHESAAMRPAPGHQPGDLRDGAGANEREAVQIVGVPTGIARGERIAV